MQTLSKQDDRRKQQVDAAFERDGFRRARAGIVRDFFTEHPVAYLSELSSCVQWAGLDWRIRPGWRSRLGWENFRREELRSLSDKQIETALRDLEALGLVYITHEGAQVIVCRTETGSRAQECVA